MFMLLKVILWIISTTLTLCFVQQKQPDDLSGINSHEHVQCTMRCAVLDQKLLLSCVTMSPIRFTCHVTQSRSSDSSLSLVSRPKRKKIKKSRLINDCVSSWGVSSCDACLFNNLMEPRGESINIMRIWIVQITPRSSDSPIKSSPTPHDPIPLI